MTRQPRHVALSLLVLLIGGFLLAPAGADDVPEDVRGAYDKAKGLFAEGEVKKAYSAISKGKAKSPDSVDFWQLYVRIWRAAGKKESTLWEKIVAKAEKKHPDSISFDMLRYRLEKDAEKRLELLVKITEKKPDALEPKLLLARAYVDSGDDDLAEEILDAILEEDPANEMALTTKGELMVESGLSASALDFVEEQLENHDLPGLRWIEARALLIKALKEEDEEILGQAEEAARKAVAGRGEPRFVLTLVDILDRNDKDADAAALLSEHYDRTKDASLAGKLGEFAFRAGDYAKAIPGLRQEAEDNILAAKALAACHARRGEAKEARAAVKMVLDHEDVEDEDAEKKWAALIELELDDTTRARKHLEGLDDDTAQYYRTWIDGWAGDVASAKALGGEKAKKGDRNGELWLVPIVSALLYEKLGEKGAALKKTFGNEGFAAAKAPTSTATPPESDPIVTARSLQFMRLYITYRHAVNGSLFQPVDQVGAGKAEEDGEEYIVIVIPGVSDCRRDMVRIFRFRLGLDVDPNDGDDVNAKLNEEGGRIWEAASEAFKEGCTALVDGDYAAAKEAFAKVVNEEPAWARARIFGAAAQALAGDAAGAVTEAEIAEKALADDFDARGFAILIRALAGQDVKGMVKTYARENEARRARYFDEL